MAVDIPFMEVTRRKDVQNGGCSILKMTMGFGLFVTFESQNLLFPAFYLKSKLFQCLKLPYKIRLLAFRSPLTLIIPTTLSAITSPRKMPGHAASVVKRLTGGMRALAPELARAGTAKLRRLLPVYSFKER